MSKLVKRILLGLLAVFVIMQFFRIDKTNPPVDASKDFIKLNNPPAEVAQILSSVCYDCHSHETKYPWYTNIAPVSWWVKGHINHGRGDLNFSKWADYDAKRKDHKLEECYEELEKKAMPLKSYTWAHSNARLTDEQRALMVDWFKSLRVETQQGSKKKKQPIRFKQQKEAEEE